MQLFSHLLVFGTLFVHCLTEGLSDRGVHNLTFAASNKGQNAKASGLLEVSKDYITKAKDFYPYCVEDDEAIDKKEKSLACLDFAMNTITEVKNKYLTCPDTNCQKYVERPIDCEDILRSGKKKSGVYTIWPRSDFFTNKSLNVYCDMETDGGGWTVIHRRGAYSTPNDFFYRDWKSYKNGFGNLSEEFWLGNDNIHGFTHQALINKLYKIRFDLKDSAGNKGHSEYNSFWIGDESTSYTLQVSGYTGINGDSMYGQNNMKFSTKDRDNDYWYYGSCAVECLGAWWFNNCHGYANLNGIYQPGVDSYRGITWHSWKVFVGLSGAEMKLRM